MVTNRNKDNDETLVKQGPEKVSSEPNKIGVSTPYDFSGKNLTPYGGLLPVITMLEKLGFQTLVEQTVTSKRIPAPWTCTGSCWESCWASTSAFARIENWLASVHWQVLDPAELKVGHDLDQPALGSVNSRVVRCWVSGCGRCNGATSGFGLIRRMITPKTHHH